MTLYRKIIVSASIRESEKLIPHQRQNLVTSRGSPLAHAYHVWLTSVIAFVSYPAHRQTDRQTDRLRQTEQAITPLRQPSSSSSSSSSVVSWTQVVDLCVQSIVRNSFKSQDKIRIN